VDQGCGARVRSQDPVVDWLSDLIDKPKPVPKTRDPDPSNPREVDLPDRDSRADDLADDVPQRLGPSLKLSWKQANGWHNRAAHATLRAIARKERGLNDCSARINAEKDIFHG
jgi:hypothetical protein